MAVTEKDLIELALQVF
jgi:hypothetical protein